MEDIYFDSSDYLIPENKFDDYLKKFSTSEILQLLSECEIIINGNESIISSLNVKGIEHFFNFITGKDTRNKRKLRRNNQELHRVSLELHRNILKRLQNNEELFQNFLRRENKRDNFFLEGLNILLDKLEQTTILAELTHWCTTINQHGYSDLPIEGKAFNVVSEYCSICKYQVPNLDKRYYTIGTALENLSANGDINIIDFFRNAISNPADIFLFEFDNCDENKKNLVLNNMSIYGSLLYYYPRFMIEEIRYSNGKEDNYLSDQFLDYASDKLKKRNFSLTIGATEFCNIIIGDILLATSEIREEIEEDNRKKLEIKKRLEDEKKRKEEEEFKRSEERRNAYIIKITPEGVWKISHNSNELLAKGKPGGKYVFSKELLEFISHNINIWKPKAWVIGKEAFNEISKKMIFPQSKAHIVFLQDYYMKLWSIANSSLNTNKSVIVFIDYYNHKMDCRGYRFDDKNKYHLIFKDLNINFNTFKNDIINLIKTKAGVREWENVEVFRTFYVKAYLNKKLDHEKMQIYQVDKKIEEVLQKSVDSFWEIIESLVDF